jgi:uncharacterized protein (DUF1330 family)
MRMPAYVIVDIEVTDPVRYEEYKRLAHETVLAYGGRYVVRGGTAERLEGSWEPHRIVVLEFPDAERARAWWSSQEYRPAKALRAETATSDMILVEGV